MEYSEIVKDAFVPDYACPNCGSGHIELRLEPDKVIAICRDCGTDKSHFETDVRFIRILGGN